MFALEFPVTSANIDAVKASLTQSLPDVKSSHRVEATARGVGFQTYAAMLAASRCTNPVIRVVNWQAFVGYLKAHGFDVESGHLYRAVAKVAIRSVLERVPRLTSHGIGLTQYTRNPDGSRETPYQHFERAQDSRKEFLNDYHVEEFLLSLAFVLRVKRIKTINPYSNSYWLKHIAENYACTYPDGRTLGRGYVSNGVLIAAAVHAGFNIRDRYGSVNVTFNMSKPSLIDLDCEFRPDGEHAQDRAAKRDARLYRLATRTAIANSGNTIPI